TSGGRSLAGLHLFRARKTLKPVDKRIKNRNAAIGRHLTPGRVVYHWSRQAPVTVRAMVLASDVLFAAGPKAGEVAFDDPEVDAALIACSARDGGDLSRCPLPAPPVFDGMAAAGGRLYLATIDGRLVCLTEKQ
ncbi:MAG: PQQ-binding-like beta-propeller repeat protein, partial [Planctomycetota bacterium]